MEENSTPTDVIDTGLFAGEALKPPLILDCTATLTVATVTLSEPDFCCRFLPRFGGRQSFGRLARERM